MVAKKNHWILLTLVIGCIEFSECTAADKIATYAKSKIGSTQWASATRDLSSEFYNDLKKTLRLIEREWIPLLGYGLPCTTLCSGAPIPGDFLMETGHVAVVTGHHLTTAPSPEANPRGMVQETDWGFRTGQQPLCMRYSNSHRCNF